MSQREDVTVSNLGVCVGKGTVVHKRCCRAIKLPCWRLQISPADVQLPHSASMASAGRLLCAVPLLR